MRKTDFHISIDLVPNEIGVHYMAAWTDRHQSYLVDEHMTELFPELEELGIADLSEGEMEYSGDMSITELQEELKRRGFYTMIST